MHPLRRFILRNGDTTSIEKAAKSVGISINKMYNLLACRILVSYKTAKRIEDFTKGVVAWQEVVEYNGKNFKNKKSSGDNSTEDSGVNDHDAGAA